MERAQSAEAKLITQKEAYGSAIERIKEFKTNFGIKERDNGEIVIDFDKLVANLGPDAAMELRSVIDEVYSEIAA